MVKLSKRMQGIADFITTTKVADIGTDHCFLPVYLVEKGICESALGMDINEGPLERAKEHIEQSKLSEKIQTRRSDGLEKLKKNEAHALIIAGMGGPLIQRILQEGHEIAHSVEQLVLQPQSEWEEFRKFLFFNAYDIVDENMILEDGKYYIILKVVPGIAKDPQDYWDLSREIKRYGQILIETKNTILIHFLSKEEQQCKQIKKQLEGVVQIEKRIARITEVEEKLMIIKAAKTQMI